MKKKLRNPEVPKLQKEMYKLMNFWDKNLNNSGGQIIFGQP